MTVPDTTIRRAGSAPIALVTGRQHDAIVDRVCRSVSGPRLADDRVGIAHRGRRSKHLRTFELNEDWIPPRTPYSDTYEIEGIDEECGKIEILRFPTFWNSYWKAYRTLAIFYGVGRKAWLQENGSDGGASSVWCAYRHGFWEIISGLFAQFAWGMATENIASGSNGVITIWWTATTGVPGSWKMMPSPYNIDVYNFGPMLIVGGDQGLSNYHPAENKWTTFGV